MELPQLSEIDALVARVAERLQLVSTEALPIGQILGRILAQPLIADRDSPPLSVSAMDGYAIRIADAAGATLPIAAVARAGWPPVSLPAGQAIQIFTGAPVPAGADCVIRREDTEETPDTVRLMSPAQDLRPGQNIRAAGENIQAGAEVLPMGTQVTAANVGTVATFGGSELVVRRRLSVSLLTSGDEVMEAGQPVKPWQIRDSNGPTLAAWLAGLPWTEVVGRARVQDDFQAVCRCLEAACTSSDVILLTGGVSAGDTDYVPQAIEALGGELLFHRLPIRPGKPVLAALLNGRLVLGLPGNPLSAAVTARVIAEPLLDRLAGRAPSPEWRVTVANPDDQTLKLTWYRLVAVSGTSARLVDSRGSGDLVSMARSHGFVEFPPGCCGPGPWRVWLW